MSWLRATTLAAPPAAASAASDRCVLLHPWPARGGLAKRLEMLAAALGSGGVRPARSWASLAAWLLGGARGRKAIIFSSLLAPLAAALRLLRPDMELVYCVRGDEAGWARQAGRRARAAVAIILQRWLARMGCRFVFVSEDLARLFERRLGPLAGRAVLPNTIGRPLPPCRAFDGRVALVGDFGTVKNIEAALEQFLAGRSGSFHVDLYGNRTLPPRWQTPWVDAHGVVDDLPRRLADSSLVVLASLSEGFPNVMVEAMEAGCGVVTHRAFPFEHLPLADAWRFDLADGKSLVATLERLLRERRDFRADNPQLFELIESDWGERARKMLKPKAERG